MRGILLGGLMALAAVGCQQQPKQKVQTSSPPAVAAPGGDVKEFPGALPAGWPDYVPPYPGATILMGTSSHTNGVPVLTAIMQTKDEPEKVTEFYGKRLSEKQFTIISTSQIEGEAVSTYRHETQSVSVSTRRPKAATRTNIEVTVVGNYEEPKEESPRTDTGNNKPSTSGLGERKKQAAPAHPLMPVYPGASTEQPRTRGAQTMLQMTTADSREQVLTYYEDFYAGQGFSAGGRNSYEDQLTEIFTSSKGRCSVIAKRGTGDTGQTAISLTFDPGA